MAMAFVSPVRVAPLTTSIRGSIQIPEANDILQVPVEDLSGGTSASSTLCLAGVVSVISTAAFLRQRRKPLRSSRTKVCAVGLEEREAVALKDGQNAELEAVLNQEYEFGFHTDIESEMLPKGVNEDIVRRIWEIKEEPDWMLDFRLNALRKWQSMEMPEWAHLQMDEIDFQDIIYYSRPKTKKKKQSLDEVDPELLKTFEKLGIPLTEQKRLSNVAVDAVFDSESIGTTFQKELAEAGVIFCSINEAIKEHPELVKKYLGTIVPTADNYFAALNSAVFSDGSFCYIPKGTRCPMEISTYFRINNKDSGQFERTLLIADESSYVSYLEGCTAPMFDSKQLHAAVVELHAAENAEIKYSTVQNWYAGDKDGRGGILNLVTKRGLCEGRKSKISWTQVETGSAVTWKYPSCVLKGDESVGEFYSVALTNNYQQADTGTKMIHLGKGSRSKIISKGISAGHSKNAYRGLVAFRGNASGGRNFSQCDSLLIGNKAEASTFPYIEAADGNNQLEHEATTSRVSQEQLLYLTSRGLAPEEAVSLVINGFCQDVFEQLPMEFAAEAQKLLSMKLEGTVG
jgi:Fe-S cluster assembly protein SufB